MPGAGAGTAGSRGVAAAPRRWAGPVSAVAAVVSPATWLAVIHLMAGMFIGAVTFTVAVTGLAVGFGTLPALLCGIPIVAVVLWLCRVAARAERARFALLLGRDIPAPPPPQGGTLWRRMWRILRSGRAWRDLGYALLRLPLGLVELALVTTVWSLALALVTVPAYNAALPGGGAHLAGVTLRGAWPLTAAALTGVVLLLVAPPVTRALAAADATVAGWLLGPAAGPN